MRGRAVLYSGGRTGARHGRRGPGRARRRRRISRGGRPARDGRAGGALRAPCAAGAGRSWGRGWRGGRTGAAGGAGRQPGDGRGPRGAPSGSARGGGLPCRARAAAGGRASGGTAQAQVGAAGLHRAPSKGRLRQRARAANRAHRVPSVVRGLGDIREWRARRVLRHCSPQKQPGVREPVARLPLFLPVRAAGRAAAPGRCVGLWMGASVLNAMSDDADDVRCAIRPVCCSERRVSASRFAPHLEKCTGKGRTGAARRLKSPSPGPR